MANHPIKEVSCVECGKPVQLTAARTDDRGLAIHPECYDERIKRELGASSKAS